MKTKSNAKTNTKSKGEEHMTATLNGTLTFTVEKMYRLPDAGHLKAFADVSVNDALVIRGVRVLEGKKGLFVSMPQEQGKDNKWYDQVVCKSASVYEELAETVMEHYRQAESA